MILISPGFVTVEFRLEPCSRVALPKEIPKRTINRKNFTDYSSCVLPSHTQSWALVVVSLGFLLSLLLLLLPLLGVATGAALKPSMPTSAGLNLDAYTTQETTKTYGLSVKSKVLEGFGRTYHNGEAEGRQKDVHADLQWGHQ